MRLKKIFSAHAAPFVSQYTHIVSLKKNYTALKFFRCEAVFKSEFLSRQGEKASNADALRGFLTQYQQKIA